MKTYKRYFKLEMYDTERPSIPILVVAFIYFNFLSTCIQCIGFLEGLQNPSFYTPGWIQVDFLDLTTMCIFVIYFLFGNIRPTKARKTPI